MPGLLTGVTGLITAVAGLITVLNTAGIIGGRSTVSLPNSPTSPAKVAVPQTGSMSISEIASDDCLLAYFQGIQEDRVFELEEGTLDFMLIGSEGTKMGTIGLKLTDNQQKVGALRFAFFLNGGIFKVESVVDSSCRPVEEYFVEGLPGEKRRMQNWDSLRIVFGSQTYVLRLGFDGGDLEVNRFVKFTP